MIDKKATLSSCSYSYIFYHFKAVACLNSKVISLFELIAFNINLHCPYSNIIPWSQMLLNLQSWMLALLMITFGVSMNNMILSNIILFNQIKKFIMFFLGDSFLVNHFIIL